MPTKRDPKQPKTPVVKNSPKTKVKIRTGTISNVRGEVNIAARDIIKNIQTIYERALTPGEVVEKDLRIETNELARGIRAYLERLKQQVATSSASIPYKGLDAYTLSDAEAFFGRDRAIRDLRKAMKRGKLTILQAESGAGKTSLLQAGIVPRLIVEKQLAVLIRSQFENPTHTIKKCFIGDLELTPKLAHTPLVDFLRRVKKIIGGSTTLYLLLDQFEEFFTKHTLEEDRQAFISDLAQCLNDATLNVRWVISITSDAFWQLGKFEPQIPNPFSNVQSLYLFDRSAATEVIARPARQHNLRIQSGLIDRLLDDLSQQQKELIAPTQIQLVCVALYDDFQGNERAFTLAQYEQQGCAEGILRGYIGNVLSSYLPREERVPAYKILEELVTSEKKRILRGKMDIEAALGNRGISADIVESALNHLVNRRLLRRLGDDTEHIQYELVHDYLLNEIELNDDMRKVKEAEELLEQGLRNWKKYGVVLNTDTLSIIGGQRKELRFTHEELCLLLMSLVNLKGHGREWRYYLSLARRNKHGPAISRTLLPFLTHESKQLRDQSNEVLWNFVRDCPAATKPRIVLWNLTFRAPIYLARAALAIAVLVVLYAAIWIISRNQLEKFGWQTLSSLPSNCLAGAAADDLGISADRSNASNIVVFAKSQSDICRSTDTGSSWVSLSQNLPIDFEMRDLAAYKELLILISPNQVFYWNAQTKTWEAFVIPSKPEAEFKSVSIGGADPEIFIGSSDHEIIAIETTEDCWKTISQKKSLDESEQGICWDQIDTDGLSGKLSFLSTNQKYIVANTDAGTWFSPIEFMNWERQDGLKDPISSFAMHTQSFFDDGIFFVVLPERGVLRGELGIPELSVISEWPFPSVNGDKVWDWPQNTKAIAVSKYVFFAATPESLQRYPGWSIFDREWWQIMREQRRTR